MERYVGLLMSPKRRGIFRDRICHALIHDLDPRYVFLENELPEEISRSVRSVMAKVPADSKCSVMSEYSDLDGLEMTLDEAERRWDAMSAILISVVPGQLVYYRPEPISQNYILFKMPS